MPSSQKQKLGEILIEAGLLTEAELRSALGEHRRWGNHLGATLVNMGLVSEPALTRALASQLGLPIVTLAGKQIHPDILELVPGDWAQKHRVVPLFVREASGAQTLFLGVGDPTDLEVLAQTGALVRMPVSAVVVAPSELEVALERFYPSTRSEYVSDENSTPQSSASVALDTSPETPSPLRDDRRSVRSLSERSSDSPDAIVDARPSSRTVVKALAQLLIDEGLIDKSALSERVLALHAALQAENADEQ